MARLVGAEVAVALTMLWNSSELALLKEDQATGLEGAGHLSVQLWAGVGQAEGQPVGAQAAGAAEAMEAIKAAEATVCLVGAILCECETAEA